MPKKRRSTKSKIVKAAWTLFHKNGYEQTTVDEIIAASKTSKGTFYHYFKGKEALLNTLSYLFDDKYEELAGIVDPDLSAYDKLLFFNHELFYMIETTIDVNLLASLYSSQLITKDKRSLLESDRYYFTWLTDTISGAIESGEFKNTSTPQELLKIYAMYERALLYIATNYCRMFWISLWKDFKHNNGQHPEKMLPLLIFSSFALSFIRSKNSPVQSPFRFQSFCQSIPANQGSLFSAILPLFPY